MNRFEKWLFERLARRMVRQGFDHQRNITALYRVVDEAATKEFYEDNRPTLHSFLRECHTSSLEDTWSESYANSVFAKSCYPQAEVSE